MRKYIVTLCIPKLLTQKFYFFFCKYDNGKPTATKNITATKEARKLFDDFRSNLSNSERKVIKRKLYKKEAAIHFFKERENDGTLTDRQRNVLKNIARYSKNISNKRS